MNTRRTFIDREICIGCCMNPFRWIHITNLAPRIVANCSVWFPNESENKWFPTLPRDSQRWISWTNVSGIPLSTALTPPFQLWIVIHHDIVNPFLPQKCWEIICPSQNFGTFTILHLLKTPLTTRSTKPAFSRETRISKHHSYFKIIIIILIKFKFDIFFNNRW